MLRTPAYAPLVGHRAASIVTTMQVELPIARGAPIVRSSCRGTQRALRFRCLHAHRCHSATRRLYMPVVCIHRAKLCSMTRRGVVIAGGSARCCGGREGGVAVDRKPVGISVVSQPAGRRSCRRVLGDGLCADWRRRRSAVEWSVTRVAVFPALPVFHICCLSVLSTISHIMRNLRWRVRVWSCQFS